MISGKKCLLGFVCSLKMSHLMKFENPVHLQCEPIYVFDQDLAEDFGVSWG